MSLRAEILRLGVRWFFKRRSEPDDIEATRQRPQPLKRFIPGPPKGTTVTRFDLGGLKSVRVASARARPDRHVLYLHGGGYVYGACSYYRDFIWRISAATAGQVLCIDYRLAPEHPFPAALDDAISAYRWLLAEGAAPAQLAVMGDSAGGGLALATLLRLRDEAVPLPAAAVGLSPWTDLALTGESLRINAEADPMLKVEDPTVFARHYLAGTDPRNPYASPLYGDPRGLPPVLMQVGSDEILRDDAVRMADKLKAAGCSVEVEVWPRMPHSWHLYARIVPEGKRALERIGAFVRRQMEPANPDARPSTPPAPAPSAST
jgi:acetyl esterase/lipase